MVFPVETRASPFLYDLTVGTTQGGEESFDTVHSYFALRKWSCEPDKKGILRFCLNGEPILLNGLLDQGYWPEGLYTPPSDAAVVHELQTVKELGFNLIVSDMSNFSEMTNAINAGNADMFAMAWQATPDPDMFQIYHSQGGSNEKSYWIKDAELDDLIMQARQSTDQTYRKTLYKECLDIVADWAVEIPVYQRQNCVIISSQRVNLDTVTPDITTYWQWYNDLELLDLK